MSRCLNESLLWRLWKTAYSLHCKPLWPSNLSLAFRKVREDLGKKMSMRAELLNAPHSTAEKIRLGSQQHLRVQMCLWGAAWQSLLTRDTRRPESRGEEIKEARPQVPSDWCLANRLLLLAHVWVAVPWTHPLLGGKNTVSELCFPLNLMRSYAWSPALTCPISCNWPAGHFPHLHFLSSCQN